MHSFVSQSEMETRFQGLSEKASYRRQRLLDSNQLFNFYREADEVEAWIAERESIATSDDYGHDLEHVETLLKKFEDFTRDLVTSGERIANLTAQAQALLNQGNSEGEVGKPFFFGGGGGWEVGGEGRATMSVTRMCCYSISI